MAATEPSEIVDVDGERVVAAARDAADGTVYSLVEFDVGGYHALFVHEDTREMYESASQMDAHFAEIHDYVNLDFTEMSLFVEDLLPVADDVRYKTTGMDVMTFVRIYLGDDRGLFLALEAGEHVEPVVEAIESAVDG